MGRSGSAPPVDRGNSDDIPEDRLSYIEEIERTWWYQYKVQYFDSLMPTQKWLVAKRNILEGDFVLIEYKNKSFPGTYRLGRVKTVEIDPVDNLVHTCTLVYYKIIKASSRNVRSIHQELVTKEIRLPVQRLVLILPIEDQ